MTGLQKLVSENISELSEGIAYFAVGKRRTGKGCRYWDMIVIYPENATREEFGDIRRLIKSDENTIIFNTYDSAWIGISEDGEYKSIKDVTDRIKAGYEAGRCRATFDTVDNLMPKKLYEEMIDHYKKMGIAV